MAAKLPYDSDTSHKPAAAAAAAAATATRGVSRATVAVLVFLTAILALSVRRVLQDNDGDRGGVAAFLVFAYLNLALLFCALRSGLVAPQGWSPAHGRAKLAVWLLTTTLTAGFVWRIEAVLVLPHGLAVAAWVVAAATQAGGFYALFLHDDEKPSAESESLIMRGCKRDDGGDLSALAS